MQKIIYTIILTFCCFIISTAQSSEKIKGNREVTIKQTYIDAFNKIIVGENFKIDIVYNEKSSVQIETDDNLHDVISFKVVDSVLMFSTSKRITSKKKMLITVNYTNVLHDIETRENAEIRSLTSLELKNASLKTVGNSKAYLNIRTDIFRFTSLDKAKVRLNLTADSSSIELSDNTKLEALINSKKIKMDLYQRANADIEGNSETLQLRVDNSSNFKGKNFTTKSCNLLSEGKSSTTLITNEIITIEASGSSAIYLYGEPKIIITKFTDTAKLQKKTL